MDKSIHTDKLLFRIKLMQIPLPYKQARISFQLWCSREILRYCFVCLKLAENAASCDGELADLLVGSVVRK